MDIALVQDAENDIDGDERGENQQTLVGERILEGGSRSLEASLYVYGQVQASFGLFNRSHCLAEMSVGRQIE